MKTDLIGLNAYLLFIIIMKTDFQHRTPSDDDSNSTESQQPSCQYLACNENYHGILTEFELEPRILAVLAKSFLTLNNS